MKIIHRIKRLIRNCYYSLKQSIRNYYVLYADSTELLEKAEKLLRPLPEGCELVKLTSESKNLYECKVGDLDKILQIEGEAWGVVNSENEIIAFHFGTYRGNASLFFNVKNCDYEHIEIKTDKRYRRNGIAVYLLYHAVKNLDFKDVKNKRVGTCVKPTNIPSLKLHKLIGFKISHRVIFFHKRRKKDGHYTFVNIPRYSI